MLTEEAVELLEHGSALIVGLVKPDGTPLATRGWGLRISADGRTARVLVATRDLTLAEVPGRPGSHLTVTGASVATLRSAQIKGPLTAVSQTIQDDAECLLEYCGRLFADVSEVDGIPAYLVERLVPDEVLACEFDVEEVFDQTPGPDAGAPVTTGAP